MKKQTRRLELKQLTVKVLSNTDMSQAVGGLRTANPDVVGCSGTCSCSDTYERPTYSQDGFC